MRNLVACAKWMARVDREYNIKTLLARTGIFMTIQEQYAIYERCVRAANLKEV